MGTGQKSSDDEVSEFVIPSKKEVISEIKKIWIPYLFVRECLYSVHETVIHLNNRSYCQGVQNISR